MFAVWTARVRRREKSLKGGDEGTAALGIYLDVFFWVGMYVLFRNLSPLTGRTRINLPSNVEIGLTGNAIESHLEVEERIEGTEAGTTA